MSELQADMATLAATVKVALEAADLTAYADLLDPDVTWGPPGQRVPTCRNRKQVLSWYQRGRDSGVRAEVGEVTVYGDRLLVGLMVEGPPADRQADPAERWQILTVRDGRVVDIVGFESRLEALVHAGVDGDRTGA
jgi:hypothetical protein